MFWRVVVMVLSSSQSHQWYLSYGTSKEEPTLNYQYLTIPSYLADFILNIVVNVCELMSIFATAR